MSSLLFTGIPVVKSAFVPLEQDVRDKDGNPTGEREKVLYMRMGDKILVHPERWDEFMRMLRKAGVVDDE